MTLTRFEAIWAASFIFAGGAATMALLCWWL